METDHKVYLKRNFDCDRATLFKWLTKPELIAQWFGPPRSTVTSVSNEVRIGGSYSIELDSNPHPFSILGCYTEIKAPQTLAFTLQYQGLPDNPPSSQVQLILSDVQPGACELTLIQRFDFLPNNLADRATAWKLMFQRLQNLL